MARAIWKGVLRCGHISVPVKFYSAVQDRAIHLRLLDRKRHEPVEQKMVDPETGRVVPGSEIGRAYPTDDRQLVLLEPEELEKLEPAPSREVRLLRFLEPERITHQWYDRPYFLGPDDSSEQYFALAEALRLEDKVGVARWVMRKQEYVGALRLEQGYLMMITLRHRGEVIPASSLAPPPGRALQPRELAIARQLIGAMEVEDLDLSAFHDEYRERVLDLVHAKARGKVIRFPRAPRRSRERSLMELLEKSLSSTERKSA
ncbi:MAG TPA: Ku protein [Longimicrobiales bacterium]